MPCWSLGLFLTVTKVKVVPASTEFTSLARDFHWSTRVVRLLSTNASRTQAIWPFAYSVAIWWQPRMTLGLRTCLLAVSCLWEATSVLHVLQRNGGSVPEINPDLLPGLIAGVKDFYQIALRFCKQAFPGWWDFFVLFCYSYFFLFSWPAFILTFYDEKFQIYTTVERTIMNTQLQ